MHDYNEAQSEEKKNMNIVFRDQNWLRDCDKKYSSRLRFKRQHNFPDLSPRKPLNTIDQLAFNHTHTVKAYCC